MKFTFHPAAEAEHLDHVAFYEIRQPGLGARYLDAFEAAMSQICLAPRRHRIARPPEMRSLRLLGFPYNVIYRESGGTVQVVAVAHLRRRPNYWSGRS